MRKLLKKNFPNWLMVKYPSHLIDQAFIECSNKFKTCLENFIKTGRPFSLNLKEKRTIIQTINLEKIMIKSTNKKEIDIFKNLNRGCE